MVQRNRPLSELARRSSDAARRPASEVWPEWAMLPWSGRTYRVAGIPDVTSRYAALAAAVVFVFAYCALGSERSAWEGPFSLNALRAFAGVAIYSHLTTRPSYCTQNRFQKRNDVIAHGMM